MIIDWDERGPWDKTPVKIYQVADDVLLTEPTDICRLNTITGDFVALEHKDGRPYFNPDMNSLIKYEGTFGMPVYVVTSDGERLPETGPATDDCETPEDRVRIAIGDVLSDAMEEGMTVTTVMGILEQMKLTVDRVVRDLETDESEDPADWWKNRGAGKT